VGCGAVRVAVLRAVLCCAVLCCAVLRVLGVGSTSCAGGAAVSVVGVVSEWGFGRTGGRVEDCGGRGEMVFWYSL
jgi:hypothetical protein